MWAAFMIDFSEYKEAKLTDICKIERAKKNKAYPKGSILIAISATKGQTYILDKETTVDGKYAVLTVLRDNPYYIYSLIKKEMQHFLQKYQTGLNIQPQVFKYFKISVHNLETQNYIAKIIKEIDVELSEEGKTIEGFKNVKKNFLDRMF